MAASMFPGYRKRLTDEIGGLKAQKLGSWSGSYDPQDSTICTLTHALYFVGWYTLRPDHTRLQIEVVNSTVRLIESLKNLNSNHFQRCFDLQIYRRYKKLKYVRLVSDICLGGSWCTISTSTQSSEYTRYGITETNRRGWYIWWLMKLRLMVRLKCMMMIDHPNWKWHMNLNSREWMGNWFRVSFRPKMGDTSEFRLLEMINTYLPSHNQSPIIRYKHIRFWECKFRVFFSMEIWAKIMSELNVRVNKYIIFT